MEQFLLHTAEIDKCTNEAMSNIEYLDLLKQPCDNLNNIQTPESMAEHLPIILHLFRFIWLNSSFYNTQERAHYLIQLINNQIIIVSRNFINLNDILIQNKTRYGVNMLNRCIVACENYKELYFKAIFSHQSFHIPLGLIDTKSLLGDHDAGVNKAPAAIPRRHQELCRDLSKSCFHSSIKGTINCLLPSSPIFSLPHRLPLSLFLSFS